MRRLTEAKVRPAFAIRPLPGYHMTTFGPGEWLVVNDANSTNNVILDADTVADLLMDSVHRMPEPEFRRGLGTMWEIDRVYE